MSILFHQKAVLQLYPNAITAFNNPVEALDKDQKPISLDMTAVANKAAELKTAYDQLAYQRKRKTEYPSIEDQLDKIYHGGIDGWKVDIKAIKDKYPKP